MQEESDGQQEKSIPRRPRRVELIAAATFALVHIFAPFVIGEKYPFTIAPMFRDQPQCYCVYEVTDRDGQQLALEDFGLHLVYDGNPVGLGVGIEAKPTLHGFGEVPSDDELIDHVRTKLAELKLDAVIVRQIMVKCQENSPHESTKTWTINADSLLQDERAKQQGTRSSD